MKDRIRKIIEEKNLSNSEFSGQTGIPKSGLSHILSGRNKPSLDYVLKILKAFPEIDTDWLLKGDNFMIKNHNQNANNNVGNNNDFEIDDSEMNSKDDELRKSPEKASNKCIEKIVVFYIDKTFDTYTPK